MPTAATPSATTDVQRLGDAARSGDNLAWAQLISRFERMLRAIARSYRLNANDSDDAIQATWVKLYEHLDGVRDSAAIAGWLATTIRREALRLLQTSVREHLTDELDSTITSHHDTPEHAYLQTERHQILQTALATLPDRQRRLMTLIAADSTTDYHHISTTLQMPIGSIGPIRARCIARLQHHHELRDFAATA